MVGEERTYVGPPLRIGWVLHYFVRTTDAPDPMYCGACCPPAEFPTTRTAIWAGETPPGAECDNCEDIGIYEEGDEWAPCDECDLGRNLLPYFQSTAREAAQPDQDQGEGQS